MARALSVEKTSLMTEGQTRPELMIVLMQSDTYLYRVDCGVVGFVERIKKENITQ